MRVGIQYADGVNTEEDFVLYPDKVEDNILYFRLAHIKEVEKKEGIYELYMSFKLPEKDELKAKFEELEFSGDNGDEVEVVITAEGGKDTILKTKAVKIRIPIKH